MRRFIQNAAKLLAAMAAMLLLVVAGLRIAITQPSWGAYPRPAGPSADPDRMRRDVRFLTSDVFPRNPRHPDNLDRAADYVRDAFVAARLDVSEQPYEAGGVRTRNIIGRLGPKDGPIVVVGAHYDVYGDLPGADDNASGVAGLLEAARLLGGRPTPVGVALVAFSTEEPPFFRSPDMGSAVYARSLRDAGVDVKAMIALEMIGFFSDRQPSPMRVLRLLYPSTGDFIVIAGRWQDRPLIQEVKKSFRGASSVEARSYCGPTRIGSDLSDHRSFWASGYPAVMIGDTAFIRNPNYHASTDTALTLDYQRMAGVVDGVVNAIVHLASAR